MSFFESIEWIEPFTRDIGCAGHEVLVSGVRFALDPRLLDGGRLAREQQLLALARPVRVETAGRA